MRVVIVHNRYRSENPSGENRVVESDIEQLRADGVEVYPYIRDSDEIASFTTVGRVGLTFRPVASPADSLALRRLLREVHPDIVHLHNPFPLISPWIIRTAKAQRVPVVQTVHNYRHVCVNGIHFRDGRLCTECVGKTIPWPAVQHGCYQGSRFRSLPMVAALLAHRNTWEMVDLFLPVGDAVADHLSALGIEDRRIEVRPNVVDDPGTPAPLGEGVVFVGRLSPEKGIEMLLEAWRQSGLGERGQTLSIAGDGELRSLVEAATTSDSSIQYLGFLDKSGLDTAFRKCALVCMPSVCREADPVAVASAFAHGRPVLATALGAMSTSVSERTGWLVDPVAEAFAAGLRTAMADVDELAVRAEGARRHFETRRGTGVEKSLVACYRRLLGLR